MTCYRYWKRTGADRDFELVRRLTERDIEKERAQERARRYGWR